MARQSEEIAQINGAYQANITKLLGALEKSQMDYLQQAEDSVRAKYLFEGKIGEKAGANSDPDLLGIRLKTEKKILDFFNEKRLRVREGFEKKRTEFLKLQTNIDNIARINTAMSDYVDSLIRLRKAQDAFGQTLLSHVGVLDKGLQIIGPVLDDVVRISGEELEKFLPNSAPKPAAVAGSSSQ